MENSQNYWDPLGEVVNESRYSIHNQKLQEKEAWYRNHPFSIKRNFFLFLLLGLVISAITIYFSGFEDLPVQILIFSFVPLVVYYSSIKSFEQNFILFLMTSKNKWVYYAGSESDRYKKLEELYSNYFTIGRSHYIEDQIWGTISFNNRPVNFWSCAFTYTTGSGKSSQTHHHSIVIVQLYKPLPISFDLQRKRALSLTSNRLKTESEEFNRTFTIKNNTEVADSKMQILKVLSPSIQVRLLQLANTFPVHVNQIGFHNDQMILDFDAEIWSFRYTNFFQEVSIDERDKEYFTAFLNEMTAIPAEMLQYID